VKPDARAKLVEGVFLRYLDARREFSLALERCAIKGWPDRRTAVRTSARVQGLFFSQLAARLTHLVCEHGLNDAMWSGYTTTLQVHDRVQELWSEQEEQTLRLRDAAYAQMQCEISELQSVVAPVALDEPFKMAKRDPELVVAGWKLNNATLAFDRELAQ
jgi:hypothetical protein